ncbi:FkbM family methyltransferase [Nostoc sp. FACHB-892]|uniref:FkbM family methyltransferase n=1 Tax=Nostoc sp. FACHB-892 TaxID=2692843 RepID=UPI001F551DA7|nr:FkbM family methyltransferase [Nostoc sp. FACHB-892]
MQEYEVKFIEKEIPGYVKNGIELHENDTVFDVGANIGLFTLWVYQQCNKNVNVFAFEPVPAVFEVLQRNAQEFDPKKLKVFPCGLSQECKTVNFAYHPNVTAMSHAYPNNLKELQNEVKQTFLSGFKVGPWSIRWISWLPLVLQSFLVDKLLEKWFQIEQITCQMRTVSDIIKENNVKRIDLLKLDVEKSELDVLLGIENSDWKKIKQVVAEVHNFDGRLEKIVALLKSQGLSEIILDQQLVFKGSELFVLYARRQNSQQKSF